jgi:hypothetical protein
LRVGAIGGDLCSSCHIGTCSTWDLGLRRLGRGSALE